MVDNHSAVKPNFVDCIAGRCRCAGVFLDADDLKITLARQFARESSPAAEDETVSFFNPGLLDYQLRSFGVPLRRTLVRPYLVPVSGVVTLPPFLKQCMRPWSVLA